MLDIEIRFSDEAAKKSIRRSRRFEVGLGRELIC